MDGAIKILPYYTYEDYIKWEGRWELLDGMPYAMSPAPAPRHQMIVSRLHQVYLNALDKVNCSTCKVYDFLDVMISEDTIVQPDVLIVCKEITKSYLDFPAELVIEVLSPATALKDKNNKFRIYQSFGVKYYLIVDPDSQQVNMYTLGNDGKYKIAAAKPNESVLFDFDFCKIDVNLEGIFN